VYDRATTAVDVQNSVTETSIYTKSIAGNDMGTNRMLELLLQGDFLHNNVAGDSIRFRVKFGGTTIYDSGAVLQLGNATGASRHPWDWQLRLENLGATNSQMMEGIIQGEFANAAAPTTGIGAPQTGANFWFSSMGLGTPSTIDTTTAQTLDLTVQWSAASVNNSWRQWYAVLELV
jgi:hypothetical protein